MSWVKQRKLPAVEAIRYQGLPCNSLPDLWYALHSSYNAAANCSVQLSILDDVPCLAPWPWVSFSMLEISEALKTSSNVSAPGPDHITWRYLKSILADGVTPLENFLRKCNMGYTLYPWISLLESTLETSYKPQT